MVEERAEEEAQEREIGKLHFGMAEETRVIAITSGKGGVGKTNLAVNLAVGLQQAGQRVMLIDADIGMANVNLLMGAVTNRSLIELLNDGVELEDVIEDGAAGVKYISGVAGVEVRRTAELRRSLQGNGPVPLQRVLQARLQGHEAQGADPCHRAHGGGGHRQRP